MSSVNTNAAAMAAIRSMSQITREMGITQARVESGLRVNNNKDDPAVFAIAQNIRADLSAMTAVKDSLAYGRATVTVASDAARKVSDELGRLKQTVLQGQQQGLDSTKINQQITNALANIDSYVNTAVFNGVNLVNTATAGALTVIRDIQGNSISVDSVDISTSATGLNLTGLDVNRSAALLTFDSTLAVANGNTVVLTMANGDTKTFEFSDGSAALTSTPTATNQVYDVQITATMSSIEGISALSAKMREAGLNANFDSQGRLVMTGAFDTATAPTTTITGATGSYLGGPAGAIAVVEGAIDQVGNTLSELGGRLRQIEGLEDFTKNLYDSIKTGLGALIDADLTEESARLSALQTKQQLAVQSLSIANQAPQALLALFR